MANENEKKVVATKKESMPAQVVRFAKERKDILDFVGSQLQENIDYGFPYEGSGKKSLLKPGAEKFCNLMQLEPVFVADLDSWQMLGAKEGMVILICFLLTADRKEQALSQLKELGHDFKLDIYRNVAKAEGRGAGSIDEKKTMNPNNLIKIVEKRALVDGVLRLAGLSEIFTQDGEEQSGNGQKENGEEVKPSNWLICPECNKKSIDRSKFKKGWYCYPRQGGCGKNFGPDEPRITEQLNNQEQKNPDKLPQADDKTEQGDLGY